MKKIFLVFIILLLSLSASANTVCSDHNQWKCDVFEKYDTDSNGFISGVELNYAFEDYFKPYVVNKLTSEDPSAIIAKLAKHYFSYYLVYGEHVDINSYGSLWEFTKFLLKYSSELESLELDFADFLFVLSGFDISKLQSNF